MFSATEMKIKSIILCALAAVALLAGCQKEKKQHIEEGEAIAVSASATSTKSLLNAAEFLTEGTSIRVIDQMTYDGDTYKYIDDVATCPATASTAAWDLDGGYYIWTSTAEHKFYGWLHYDAYSDLEESDLFGDDLTLSAAEKISTGSITMDLDTPQFDFLYAQTEYRDASDHSTVDLTMEHLFTAFGIGFKNTSENDVTIEEFHIDPMWNIGSAEVDWSGTIENVTYGTLSRSAENFLDKTDLDIELASGASYADIINGSANTRSYWLMWPQPLAKIAPLTPDPDPETARVYAQTDSLITLKYSIDGSEMTTHLAFPQNSWDHGHRYYFTVTFADKLIELNVSVLPWDYEEEDIDFSSGTVTVKEGAVLQFDNTLSIVDDVNHTVTIRQGIAPVGSFHLDTPRGATYFGYVEGDYDAFRFEIIGEDTIGDDWSMFKVVPLETNPTRNYSVDVCIRLRLPDGRIVDADPVLQATKYTIILPAA